MVRRERKLRMSPLSQRAYSLPLASRRDINRQIRLRVVREFNLPDSIAEVLESAAYQFAEEADDSQPAQPHQTQHVWEQRKLTPLAVRVPLPPKRNSATPARNRYYFIRMIFHEVFITFHNLMKFSLHFMILIKFS